MKLKFLVSISLLFHVLAYSCEDSAAQSLWNEIKEEIRLYDKVSSHLLEQVADLPFDDLVMLRSSYGYKTVFHDAIDQDLMSMEEYGYWQRCVGKDPVFVQEKPMLVHLLLSSYIQGKKAEDQGYRADKDLFLSELLSFASKKGRVDAIAVLQKVGARFAWMMQEDVQVVSMVDPKKESKVAEKEKVEVYDVSDQQSSLTSAILWLLGWG